jgi:multiple sugar transport system permease protein
LANSAIGISRGQRLTVHLALVILCLPAFLPFVWMVATSLKPESQVFSGQGSSPLSSLLPRSLDASNYTEAFKNAPLDSYLFNSVGLALTTVLGSVLSSALVAYGFARVQFRGRDILFMIMVATMALPSQVTMIPQFTIYRWLGWYGTYLPLAVPAFLASPFFVFLMTQFFRSLPEETSESARLDGANDWTIFTRIVLPLAKPALATCALFQFLGSWNDFMGPLIYINDPKRYTLAYGLQQFYSSYGGKWAQLMAAATLFTLPIIVLFFFAQKTFIQGIATTGGKS